MSCGTLSLKYLELLLTVLLALACIGIIFVGAKGLNGEIGYGKGIFVTSIAGGGIGLVLSIFGCVAVIKKSIFLTLVYAFSLLILVCLTIVALSLPHDVTPYSLRTLDMAWEEEIKGKDSMSQFQEKFNCCGILGPIDYHDAKMSLPKSCFSQDHSVFPRGCLAKMKDFYNNGLETLMFAGWIFFAIQSLAYVFATIMSLAFQIEQRKTRDGSFRDTERERLFHQHESRFNPHE